MDTGATEEKPDISTQQALSNAYMSLKCRYQLLKQECAEKGRKNAELNDKYLESRRRIKQLEMETPDLLLERIHGMTTKIEILQEQLNQKV